MYKYVLADRLLFKVIKMENYHLFMIFSEHVVLVRVAVAGSGTYTRKC